MRCCGIHTRAGFSFSFTFASHIAHHQALEVPAAAVAPVLDQAAVEAAVLGPAAVVLVGAVVDQVVPVAVRSAII